MPNAAGPTFPVRKPTPAEWWQRYAMIAGFTCAIIITAELVLPCIKHIVRPSSSPHRPLYPIWEHLQFALIDALMVAPLMALIVTRHVAWIVVLLGLTAVLTLPPGAPGLAFLLLIFLTFLVRNIAPPSWPPLPPGRCTKCYYDLSGLSPDTTICPECGASRPVH